MCDGKEEETLCIFSQNTEKKLEFAINIYNFFAHKRND